MGKNWWAAVICAFAGRLPAAAAAAAAAGHVVKVTAGDCRRVVAHVAAADVEFRPGVDVRGRKVAPADLGGTPRVGIPDTITFDLQLDLEELAGPPPPGTVGEVFGRPVLGHISIRGHEVYFNDRLLGDMAEAELARKCREMLRRINRRD
ncbi:MAG: hypothetical protein ACE5FR_02905 [Rhodospirillales bacterium]